MLVPEFMPVLSKGAHSSPADGASVMEMVSYLAGEKWSDSPACTHPMLAEVARSTNDHLPDDLRHLMLPLIGRLFGTAEPEDLAERKMLRVKLGIWSARKVQHLLTDERSHAAITAAQAWVDCPCKKHQTSSAAAAASAADAAAAASAASAAYAAYAAACAAYAAYAASAADAAAAASAACAAYAAYAASAADAAAAASAASAAYAASAASAAYAADAADAADARLQFMTDLLDEYDRLTGRTTHREVTADDLASLAALTNA